MSLESSAQSPAQSPSVGGAARWAVGLCGVYAVARAGVVRTPLHPSASHQPWRRPVCRGGWTSATCSGPTVTVVGGVTLCDAVVEAPWRRRLCPQIHRLTSHSDQSPCADCKSILFALQSLSEFVSITTLVMLQFLWHFYRPVNPRQRDGLLCEKASDSYL